MSNEPGILYKHVCSLDGKAGEMRITEKSVSIETKGFGGGRMLTIFRRSITALDAKIPSVGNCEMLIHYMGGTAQVGTLGKDDIATIKAILE